MQVARITIAVFLILALLAWTLHLLMGVVFHAFGGVFDYALLLSLFGLLVALGHIVVNTLFLNLFVAMAGSFTTGLMLWDLSHTDALIRSSFTNSYCALPTLFAWVAAGCSFFLRVTHGHPCQRKTKTNPADVTRRTLKLFSVIGFFGWLLMLTLSLIALLTTEEWLYHRLPTTIGSLLLVIGYSLALIGLEYGTRLKSALALVMSVAGCVAIALEPSQREISGLMLFCVLMALLPRSVLNRMRTRNREAIAA